MRLSPVIIVSNDDATFMDLIDELLTEEGYPSVLTVVGDRAYDVILEKQPDLLIIDINLRSPATSWTTLDRVKLNPRTATIPIIICSTDHSLPDKKADWFRKRQVDFLEKPFVIGELLEKITAHVGPPPSKSM